MKIELSPHAQRQLNRIRQNQALAVRLAEGLEAIAENPYCGKELSGKFKGVHSYRVGDWRILYEIYQNQLLILVINIAHRREVYRRFFRKGIEELVLLFIYHELDYLRSR